jgi:hypothetical protein
MFLNITTDSFSNSLELTTIATNQTFPPVFQPPDGCKSIILNDNQHGDIVSVDFEAFAYRLKAAILLPILFLIGGPANVINMAVFYRQGLSKRINVCLFALALADELYLIHCMILNGEEFHRQFYTKERCVLSLFLTA